MVINIPDALVALQPIIVDLAGAALTALGGYGVVWLRAHHANNLLIQAAQTGSGVAYNALLAASRRSGKIDFDAARVSAVADGVQAARALGTLATKQLLALPAAVDGGLGNKLAADPTVSALGGSTATASAPAGEAAVAVAGADAPQPASTVTITHDDPPPVAAPAAPVAAAPAPAAPAVPQPDVQAVVDQLRALIAEGRAMPQAPTAPPSPSVLAAATKLIAGFEGCKLAPYQDISGKWTIGYGLTRLHGAPVTADTPPLSQADADAALSAEVSSTLDAVHGMVTRPMTDGQAEALTSLAFNVGEDALRNSTLLTLFNAGQDEGAAAQFPRWCHSAGKVVQGLVTRRAKERAIFETKLPVIAAPAPSPVATFAAALTGA